MKILIVKTSSLGDVIHCLPVINDILAHDPNAQIDWVVEESFIDIPKLHPAINEVFTVVFRRWRKQLLNTKTWAEIRRFRQIITSNQYDIIIDTQGLLKSALITQLAKGVKHGYNKQSIREPLASRFYDKTHAISYQQHAVVRNRALAALSLGYAMPANVPDYGIESHRTQSTGTNPVVDFNQLLDKSFVIALHGTSRESKLWPTGHWIYLGEALQKLQLNLVLPWSNRAELIRAEQIANAVKNVVVLPKLGIAELAAVISQAAVAVGVDTGLSHLAVALNIPTIAIYTDTNPALTGVMASLAPAINLGNIAQIPSVEQVMMQISSILPETQAATRLNR